ncbi:MAG: ATP-binding protein [Desulfobacterales bacterium]|nr:ATP-binding protein [Desulfobacterales bacterium]
MIPGKPYPLTRFGLTAFALLFSATTLVFAGFYFQEFNFRKQTWESAERQKLELLEKTVGNELKANAYNLIYLTNHQQLHHWLHTASHHAKESAAALFLRFCRQVPRYDQVRFIDRNGMERIRVNRNGETCESVPEAHLQDKSGRYYYKDIFNLERGQIFISPFDLNVEHGKVEQPPKPMIRFGMPIFDTEGERLGIVLLNYLGAHLLETFDEKSRTGPGELMLLNPRGYWLKAPDPNMAWGFMFEDRLNLTLADRDPGLWERLNTNDREQFYQSSALYTYTTIRFTDIGLVSSLTGRNGRETTNAPGGSRDFYWKMVSIIPEAALTDLRWQVFRHIFPYYGLVTLILAGITLLLSIVIRQRKQAKAELARNEAELSSFFRSVPAGIGITSDRIILQANKRLCEMTGYSHDELVGQSARILYPSDMEYLFVGKAKYGQISDKGTGSVETVWRTKAGKSINVLLSSTPLDPEDLSKGVTFCAYDMTEEKKARETIERVEKQLHQSQKMEAIGTLAGGIAHDFNNILSGIFGYARLVRMSLNDPEKAEQRLDQLQNVAQRAVDLVQQILTFSRKAEQEKLPLTLSITVKESVKLLRSSLPSSIQMATNLACKEKVSADPTQVQQVVMNLCTNAYHAMMPEGGELTINLTRIHVPAADLPDTGLTEGPYLELEVRDTGAGIPEDTMDKIFDPYFTTKEAGKGTGLGLALVDGIVKKHDGYITVDSTPGAGTVFRVFWPVITGKAEVETQSSAPGAVQGGSETLMLVDDEADILTSLPPALEDYGYTVVPFSDGQSALAAFRENPNRFQLIITDRTMPGMSGDHLARDILTEAPDLPIILCTGYNAGGGEITSARIGIRRYVQKPVRMRTLLKLIRELLDN